MENVKLEITLPADIVETIYKAADTGKTTPEAVIASTLRWYFTEHQRRQHNKPSATKRGGA